MRISDWSSDVCSSDLLKTIATRPDRIDVVTVTPNRLCPIRLPLMKPNTAGIAARIMKYPVYRPLIVAGSAAITGHSLFGDRRIDLARSTRFAVSKIGKASGRERGCRYG